MHRVELIIRNICLSFCMATFIIMGISEMVSQLEKWTLFNIPIFYIILIIACMPFTQIIQEKIKEVFDVGEEDWEGEEEAQAKWVTFYRYLGLTTLYFLTQLGIAVLFFPKFIEYQVLSLPFFVILFLFNCYCIIWVYSRTVFKQKLTLNDVEG